MLFGKYSDDSREGSMRKFAETNECRRQVLLDALGGEKAYCEGCDLCLKLKKSKADWENVYELVKKRKNFYSEENLNEKTMLMMNKKSRNFSSANICHNLLSFFLFCL